MGISRWARLTRGNWTAIVKMFSSILCKNINDLCSFIRKCPIFLICKTTLEYPVHISSPATLKTSLQTFSITESKCRDLLSFPLKCLSFLDFSTPRKNFVKMYLKVIYICCCNNSPSLHCKGTFSKSEARAFPALLLEYQIQSWSISLIFHAPQHSLLTELYFLSLASQKRCLH